jgi:hypothetical protein
MPKPEVLFVLSVDTEEEWDWADAFPEQHCNVTNVNFLPDFQAFCQSHQIRPTYFVDYPVLTDAVALTKLKRTIATNDCEVGGHLHPWCNPPFFGNTGEYESHVVNLPIGQVKAKLDRLIDKVYSELGLHMRSFRTGRWGIDEGVMSLLIERGFTVDSSVYPMYHNEHFSCEEAHLRPYWPNLTSPNQPGEQRCIAEIPVTVGFNRTHEDFWRNIMHRCDQSPWRELRATALLWHSHICRKIYLSPELSSVRDMQRLIRSKLDNRYPVIHMYLHSSSFLDGGNGFYRKADAFASMCQAIATTVQYLQQHANVRFATISEAAHLLQINHDVTTAKDPVMSNKKRQEAIG